MTKRKVGFSPLDGKAFDLPSHYLLKVIAENGSKYTVEFRIMKMDGQNAGNLFFC